MESVKKILRTPSAFVILLAAVLTLFGVIIKSKSDIAIARLPIDATLTAEAKLAQVEWETSFASWAQTEGAADPTLAAAWTSIPLTRIAAEATQTAVLHPEPLATDANIVKVTVHCLDEINFTVYDSNGVVLVEIICSGTQTISLPKGEYTYQYQKYVPFSTLCPGGGCAVIRPTPPPNQLSVSGEPITLSLP